MTMKIKRYSLPQCTNIGQEGGAAAQSAIDLGGECGRSLTAGCDSAFTLIPERSFAAGFRSPHQGVYNGVNSKSAQRLS
jgi:hypothetical protein